MKKSLAASVVFHSALVFSALFALPSPAPLLVPPAQAVMVDISTISDTVKQKTTTTEDAPPKPTKAPKKSDVKAEPAPKVADKIEKAVKEPAAVEPPSPPKPPEKPVEKPAEKPPEKPVEKVEEPKKEELKKPEPKKEEPKKLVEDKPLESDPLKDLLKEQQVEEEKIALEQKKLEEKKKIEEQKKAEVEEKKKVEAEKKKAEAEEKKKAEAEAKKRADAEAKKQASLDAKKKKAAMDDIAEFLNKEEGERAAPQESAEDGSPDKAEKASKGDDSEMISTLTGLIKSKLASCWTKPPAAVGSGITVKIAWQMRKDGTLVGQPVPVSGAPDDLHRVTTQSAISAVLDCQPFNELPADRYDLWKEIVWDFTP
jgi:colicin import membrane protein